MDFGHSVSSARASFLSFVVAFGRKTTFQLRFAKSSRKVASYGIFASGTSIFSDRDEIDQILLGSLARPKAVLGIYNRQAICWTILNSVMAGTLASRWSHSLFSSLQESKAKVRRKRFAVLATLPSFTGSVPVFCRSGADFPTEPFPWCLAKKWLVQLCLFRPFAPTGCRLIDQRWGIVQFLSDCQSGQKQKLVVLLPSGSTRDYPWNNPGIRTLMGV